MFYQHPFYPNYFPWWMPMFVFIFPPSSLYNNWQYQRTARCFVIFTRGERKNASKVFVSTLCNENPLSLFAHRIDIFSQINLAISLIRKLTELQDTNSFTGIVSMYLLPLLVVRFTVNIILLIKLKITKLYECNPCEAPHKWNNVFDLLYCRSGFFGLNLV